MASTFRGRDSARHSQSFHNSKQHQEDDVPPLSKIDHVEEWIGTLTDPNLALSKQPEDAFEQLNNNSQEQDNDRNILPHTGKSSSLGKRLELLLEDLIKKPTQNMFSPGKLSAKESLSLLLTSQSKLNHFVNKLMVVMPQSEPKAARNCEMLILLLRKVRDCDYQVIQSNEDIKLKFSSKFADSKKKEIEELESKIHEKEVELGEIVGQYEKGLSELRSTIHNLNRDRDDSELDSPVSRHSPIFRKPQKRLEQ